MAASPFLSGEVTNVPKLIYPPLPPPPPPPVVGMGESHTHEGRDNLPVLCGYSVGSTIQAALEGGGGPPPPFQTNRSGSGSGSSQRKHDWRPAYYFLSIFCVAVVLIARVILAPFVKRVECEWSDACMKLANGAVEIGNNHHLYPSPDYPNNISEWTPVFDLSVGQLLTVSSKQVLLLAVIASMVVAFIASVIYQLFFEEQNLWWHELHLTHRRLLAAQAVAAGAAGAAGTAGTAGAANVKGNYHCYPVSRKSTPKQQTPSPRLKQIV